MHESDSPHIGHSTNLVGIPSGLLTSTAFNEHPLALRISGVRDANRGLFDRLQGMNHEDSAQTFQDYMYLLFGLHGDPMAGEANAPMRFCSSYLKLLEGWGFDSSSPQGAVLKGWVESRFGLLPTFHKEPLLRYSSSAWMRYVEDKMCSRFHNNSINLQLDLLYEYCQWRMGRIHGSTRGHLTLYRGVNHCVAQRPLGRKREPRMTVRLNNLVSFTSVWERACEFGDIILEAQVPICKILFLNELLPNHPLRGESEHLVIGGEYQVKATYHP